MADPMRARSEIEAVTARVDVSDGVRRKATAVGPEGQRWLHSLPELIVDVEEEWGIDVGASIPGGSAAYVAHATTSDGSSAVLKMAIPDALDGQGPFLRELETVKLGQGRGYVRLLRSEARRRVMLQGRLGRPLGELGRPIEAQIDLIANCLARSWRPVSPALPWWTGADQAQWLHDFVATTWTALDRPCAEPTIRHAQRCALARRDAFDRPRSVLIHGDAHPWNLLEDLAAADVAGGFKLIDPDGMLSEPAHDLAIPLRHWNAELLAERDPTERVRAWCQHLAERMAVPADAIWDWAFIERVSTGLFLLTLGHDEGHQFLQVAEALTDR